MSEFQDSEEKRMRLLLNQVGRGDQHPSRFLICMRYFAEDKVSDDQLKLLYNAYRQICKLYLLSVVTN